MMKNKLLLLSGFLLSAALILWQTGRAAIESNILTARKVSKAPVLDAKIDALWKESASIRIPVMGGANLPNGRTEVSLKAVYTNSDVFFLAQWQDKTQSHQRSPWKKRPDGSWLKVKDPADTGGDSNQFYEDKFAMIWSINIAGFEAAGCMVACHAGEAGKAYGNKYTKNSGERGDIWHWKAVRTGPVDQIDDQYLDDTRYDKDKSPEAGRKSDSKTAGGYVDNVSEDKKLPKFAAKGNRPAPPYWIFDRDKESFDDTKYKPGNEVAGIVVAPFLGDRGDIRAKAAWSKGVWTLEFSRKLKTESPNDVQFDDRTKTYAFGVAVFDNAQVRHAFAATPNHLKFGK